MAATYKTGRKASLDTDPMGTLIVDFQPPEFVRAKKDNCFKDQFSRTAKCKSRSVSAQSDTGKKRGS